MPGETLAATKGFIDLPASKFRPPGQNVRLCKRVRLNGDFKGARECGWSGCAAWEACCRATRPWVGSLAGEITAELKTDNWRAENLASWRRVDTVIGIRTLFPSYLVDGWSFFTFLNLRRDDVEYSVKLSHLPATVSFSDRLSERLRYDASRGELFYRGFMTKCAYDEISGLSDDPDYHRAVERLFVLTSAEIAPPSNRFSMRVLATAAAVVMAVVVLIWATVRHTSGQRTIKPPQTATASTAS